ncbi:PspA/IM30 family protein [Actinoallomurus sp. CA-150999]|uniref:PspA/IM30 family protein n=1 Tax=Actinoallomurus sp. CA-150999 TaxID=3239887 RepID=UPI003D9017FA
MSREVRDWLATLLAEDQQAGRVVGEAVTVLFEGGSGLGEPLVVPLQPLLRAEHPRIALDHAYQRQRELLHRIRRSVADLATERKRLELRIGGGHLDQEALADARRRYAELVATEEQATLSVQRLQARVDAFRVRKEAVKARYTAAQVKQDIDQAFAALDESHVPGSAADDVTLAQAATAELLHAAADLEQRLGVDVAPEMLSELRLATADLRLLFAAESPDTAVLLVVGIGHDDWSEWYEEALPLARAELQLQDDDFTGYDLAAFLSEYFPGEEAEVQAGATRLIELNRAIAGGP